MLWGKRVLKLLGFFITCHGDGEVKIINQQTNLKKKERDLSADGEQYCNRYSVYVTFFQLVEPCLDIKNFHKTTDEVYKVLKKKKTKLINTDEGKGFIIYKCTDLLKYNNFKEVVDTDLNVKNLLQVS